MIIQKTHYIKKLHLSTLIFKLRFLTGQTPYLDILEAVFVVFQVDVYSVVLVTNKILLN